MTISPAPVRYLPLEGGNLGISVAKFTFAECTRECVIEFMDYLAEMNSVPSTRNQRLAALKSYLTFAADKDITLQSSKLEVKRVPQCKVPSSTISGSQSRT